ncbi:hypothetical protein PV396_27860 [Streptomyces sp. ME02-8801-2C]|uniref:hypothetical protein n=1 Tax=Streptomyces sp. ME02-8801-2C TaxID=3028680 RepID=UPI0029BD28FC|nr:hypothetical protein [Streptomyces sp. ME02-8801-2C]MDX3455710.1 hypothetical protein [Streptomyces sp. ME02-8801-2C]
MKHLRNHTQRTDHTDLTDPATPASSPLRLLPWPSLDGKPCYLVADDNGGGYLSRLADGLEATQLATAVDVLGLARPLLDDPASPYTEVRYAGLRLAECLTDALRVAESRGMRLPVPDTEDGGQNPQKTGSGLWS